MIHFPFQNMKMPELLPTNTIEFFSWMKKEANGFQWGIVVFGQHFWTVCIMGKNSFEIQFNRKKNGKQI